MPPARYVGPHLISARPTRLGTLLSAATAMWDIHRPRTSSCSGHGSVTEPGGSILRTALRGVDAGVRLSLVVGAQRFGVELPTAVDQPGPDRAIHVPGTLAVFGDGFAQQRTITTLRALHRRGASPVGLAVHAVMLFSDWPVRVVLMQPGDGQIVALLQHLLVAEG